ncbi:oxidoreductase [Cohnella sp. CFH 77786]|uniref:Gfo/Idh/MocA family protein n=1 Tax=Cohnella sp. CFH 77786 TaxID=2662265 RepID=UPI001C60CEA5|nr:Gfo/Idh/MocA family oxidoreductase [Cohnella sp. CFH 77786]MBW5448037.1 oxidoreductase [Cohnella sp. CFH 77786]
MRFGIIGTNWIVDQFLEAAREVEGFELAAVYSRTEEKARAFASKHGAAHTFTDLAAMAASDTIDAVYIASPNSLHAEQAILCMNRGKHVLCEKPAASSAKEFRAMAEAAARNGVVLMEAMKSTLLPNFRAIRENLPKLGKVRRYVANYCQYSSRYDAYKRGELPNAFNPVFSNGALMDLGVYGVYPLAVLFGKPHRIQATGVMLDSGVDGEGSLLLQYPDMDAVIMYSKIADSALPSEIQGEAGSMLIHRISQPQQVEIRYRDGREEDLTLPQSIHAMAYEIREFIGLVRSGQTESAINSHANSLLTLEIVDEARRQLGLVYPADR